MRGHSAGEKKILKCEFISIKKKTLTIGFIAGPTICRAGNLGLSEDGKNARVGR